jgi:glyoxylase-like metal-dependent hydrolase (beta-lactamase superfamily II)
MPPMRKVKINWQTGLINVGKGCYAYIQTGGLNISNAGLVVGRDSCLVIDTLYVKPIAQAFQRAIRRVTKKPIGQIIYTHHHADHTLGSNFFPKNPRHCSSLYAGTDGRNGTRSCPLPARKSRICRAPEGTYPSLPHIYLRGLDDP